MYGQTYGQIKKISKISDYNVEYEIKITILIEIKFSSKCSNDIIISDI